MKEANSKHRIGILGGGPSGLFMYKQLVDKGDRNLDITIIERKDHLGAGMPYSPEGASMEHITNVSDNEIPEIVTSMKEWLRTAPNQVLEPFNMKPGTFNEYKVVPRLLFGIYLEDQFKLLQAKAKKAGIKTNVLFNTSVINITDHTEEERVEVNTNNGDTFYFDKVIISTGHNWPKRHEGNVNNWFDSPYPPSKLAQQLNFPVAIKGSSLSAIDAVRTLARKNGHFTQRPDKTLEYQLNDSSIGFKIVMHSLGGFLPAMRFHLEDSHLSKDSLLNKEQVQKAKDDNGGFVPLDYLFEYNFLEPLRLQNHDFYEQVKNMKVEEFVAHVMDLREKLDAFVLFKAEYAEAEKSIKRLESVYWKEMLAVLSYAMNYPAKHLSAEDMLRLKKVLMPLISIVIAFVPQSSAREMIALYDAGILSVIEVDKDSKVEPGTKGGAIYSYKNAAGEEQKVTYNMFVDAVGQPAFMFKDFPFNGLKEKGTVSAAFLRFKDNAAGIEQLKAGNDLVEVDTNGDYYLNVPGININDHFQVLDKYGVYNPRIYIMAVPYISGLNPDYSGLDFCEEASGRIVKSLLKKQEAAV